MENTKKNISCPCNKKNINEFIEIKSISEDMMSAKFQDSSMNFTLDFEKFKDGTFSITPNEEQKLTRNFKNLTEALDFMNNKSEKEFNSEKPKMFLSQKKVMEAFNNFIQKDSLLEYNKKNTKEIIITVNDSENTIEELLNSIKKIGNGGHGFEISMDKDLKSENEEKGIKTDFYWDGDGGDSIIDIKIKENKEEIKESVSKEMDKGEKQIYNILIKHFKLLKKFKKLASQSGEERFTGFTKEETKLNAEVQKLKNEAWALSRRENIDTNRMMQLSKLAETDINNNKKLSESEIINNKIDEIELEKEAEEANIDLSKYDEEQIRIGMKVELEHGKSAGNYNITNNDMIETLKIVLVHLDENPKYYTGLKESGIEDKKMDENLIESKNILKEAKKTNLKISSNSKRELIKKAKIALDSTYSIYDIVEKLDINTKQFIDNLDKAFEGINELLTILVTTDSVEEKK